MVDTIPVMLVAATAAIPAIAHVATEGSWSKKMKSRPSIFNQDGFFEKGPRAKLIGAASSVASTCIVACASLAAGVALPQTLLLAGSAGFAGSLAAIDAKYRRVPVPHLIAMGACAALAAGSEAAMHLGIGAALGAAIYALSAFVSHKIGREVFGLGDVMLVTAVSAAFGTSPLAWQRFIVAATVALVAALVYMKAKDNDELVPLFTLMLIPYLLGLTGVA